MLKSLATSTIALFLSGCQTVLNCDAQFNGPYSAVRGHKAMYINEGKKKCAWKGESNNEQEAREEAYKLCTQLNGEGCILWSTNDQLSSFAQERTQSAVSQDNQLQAANMMRVAQATLQPSAALISPPAVVGGQVLSPSPSTNSRTRQPVENMNRCKQVQRVNRPNSFDVWRLYNNCPVPVAVAWCEAPGCRIPSSSTVIKASSHYDSPALLKEPDIGAVLYCPEHTINTADNGVWACWPK